MKEVWFAVPGDLATPTGGYGYDRRILAGLAALGWRTSVVKLGEGFPFPTPQVRKTACACLADFPAGRRVVIDGLALGVLPEMAEALHRSHRLIALVHHPLACETGLSPAQAAALGASERAALSFAHRVVATSATTARLLVAEFGVAPDRMAVVQPGTERAAIGQRIGDSATPTLLSVGSVVPRKGYDLLIEALAEVASLPWRLLIVGDRERNPDTAQAIDAAIAHHRLGERVRILGAVAPERLDALYRSADLFVLASRYEGYGMAYAEAIAHGLPVLGTTAGAIPEVVSPDAGLLVAPDDVAALAGALRRLLTDPKERATLAAGARTAAAELPDWPQQAALFADILEQCG